MKSSAPNTPKGMDTKTPAEKLPERQTAAVHIDPDLEEISMENDLHKRRPSSPDHLGQIWWRNVQLQKQAPTQRFGFERLGHMHSVGIPFKFEELQGRHPFDFIKETEAHFREPPTSREKSDHVRILDSTLLERKLWIEPLRKGQSYYDYCRDKWMSRTSQLGSVIAPVASFYSLWSVTDTILGNGGVIFAIMYFIITILFITPMIYIELALGQFHRAGPVKTMKQVCPLLLGVGYLMFTMCIMDYLFSLTRLSWLVFYVTSSFFRSELPWGTCENPWNTPRCKVTFKYNETNVTYAANELTSAVEKFRFNILRYVQFINPFESDIEVSFSFEPNWGIVWCFLCMILCHFCISRLNCRELGKLMYFSFKFAIHLLVISFLIWSSITEKEMETRAYQSAYEWFIQDENWNLLLTDSNAWIASFKHAIVSSGVGTGIHIAFGSHNSFINDKLKICAVINGLTSYFLHLCVAFFFILCHFLLRTSTAFETNSTSYGNDTLFEIFSEVLVHQSFNRWYIWILFITMAGGLVIISILRSVSSLRTIQQHFHDMNKLYYDPLRTEFSIWEKKRALRQKRLTFWMMSARRKTILAAILILLMGIIQILWFLPWTSVYLFFFESVWYKYVPPLIIAFECFGIFFFLGVRTLNSYIRKMTRCHVTLLYRFVWRSLTPAFIVIYFVHIGPWVESFPFAICCGLVLFLLLAQSSLVVKQVPTRGPLVSLRLAACPEHDHEDIIRGERPLTRFHWMHHVSVPRGIGSLRMKCVSKSNGVLPLTGLILSTYWEVLMWDLFWNKLQFRSICSAHCCMRIPRRKNQATIFSAANLRLSRRYREDLVDPEYVPNKQINNVLRMKTKYSTVTSLRNRWMKEKVKVGIPSKGTKLDDENKKGSSLKDNNTRHTRMDGNLQQSSGQHKDFHEDGTKKKRFRQRSSSEGLSEDFSTSEIESELMSDSETSEFEESFDDNESLEWEYTMGPTTGKKELRQGPTLRNKHDDLSLIKKLWDKSSVANYMVDELMEFDEVMESHKTRKEIRKRQQRAEADSDSEERYKVQKRLHHNWRRQKIIEEINKDFASGEDESFADKQKKIAGGQQRDSGGGLSDDDDDDEDEDEERSCSSSCTEDSLWSSRSSSGPDLEEQPDVIVSRKSKKHSTKKLEEHEDGRKSKQKGSKKNKKAMESESVHGPFRKQKGAAGVGRNIQDTGKQIAGDIRARLLNFLRVNVTSRRKVIRPQGKHNFDDSLSD